VAALLLIGQNCGDLAVIARVRLRAPDGVCPRSTIAGIATEKRREGRKIVGVVGSEPTGPRKPAHVDRDTSGGFARGVGLNRRFDVVRAHEIGTVARPKRLNPGCFSATIQTPSFQEYPLNTDAAGNAPPDAFGPFRVLHQIGAGALGPVFRAYQPEQDRLVAVKLFRIDLPPERAHQLVVRLQRLIAADLTHAGIAAPLATGISDVAPYLAMDFVAADSLDIIVRDQQGMAPSEVARVATQLASALDLAAAIGITHGALHPRDVLISSDDVRITGIGIAKALEEVGLSAPIRRPYTAPERTSAGWDRRADVFSLAALIFELLTRRRVSGPGDQPYDAFNGVAGVSADALDRVFDRALAERPGDRFATAGDFAKALQAAVDRKRSVTPRVVRAPEPAPVVEPSAALPIEEFPLFTDSMLDERGDTTASGDAEPPPIVDRSHEALAPDLSFRDVPLSMVESLHEPEGTISRGPVIDDLHSGVHDAGDHRLSIDDFTEVVHETAASSPHDHPLKVDEPLAGGPHVAESKPHEEEFDIQEVFAREAAEVPAPSRPAPFESLDAGTPPSSGVWPLMLALVVGIALGFGMAMLLLGRDRVPPAPQQASTSTSGRTATEVRDEPIKEVTEQTVASAPKPAAPQPATPTPSASVATPNEPVPAKPTARAENPVARTPAATPQGRTPLPAIAAKTPTPPKAAAAAKPAPNTSKAAAAATKPAAAAAKGAPAPGRGANKAVAATPAKPAVQAPEKPPSGSLVVESRPPGASVFLDGRRVGTTPLTLDTVKVGNYTIGLDIPGYQRWASTVKVTSGERSRVAASLER
jgi:serine/threonine protein kinase